MDDLRVGRLDQIINKELLSRPYFIPVLSPQAVESEWVKAEMSSALSLQHKHPDERILLPVVARTCEIPPLIEPFKRIAGQSRLTPKEAADGVICALRLTPVRLTLARLGRPKTVEDAIIQGKSLIAQGRPREALEVFEIALKIDESSAAAWSGKGRALHDLRQLDAAMDAYAHAVECDPDEANGWAGRGQIRGETGDYVAALSDLDQTLKLKPDYLAPLLNRSTVLLNLGRLDEALAAAEEGVRLEPNYGPGLAARGRVLQVLGLYDEALAAYEAALAAPDIPEAPATTPENWRVPVLFHKAEVLFALRCPAAALVASEQALQHDEHSCLAWKSKGDALWHLGRHREALDAYEHALAAATTITEQASAWHDKGVALLGLGEPVEAKTACMRALALKPNWSEALHGLADALRDLNDLPQAVDTYRRALDQGTLTSANAAEAWNSLAVIAQSQGDVAGALVLVDRAIAANSSNARFWLNKVNILVSLSSQDQEDVAKVQQQLGQCVLAKAAADLLTMPNVHMRIVDAQQ